MIEKTPRPAEFIPPSLTPLGAYVPFTQATPQANLRCEHFLEDICVATSDALADGRRKVHLRQADK